MSPSRRLPVLILLLFVVSACAPGGGGGGGGNSQAKTLATESTNPGPESGQVHLTLSGGYAEMDPVYKQAADAYHKLHPNVTISVTPAPDLRSYEQKLTVALPSRTSTDIVIRTVPFLSRFIDANLLAPVPTWMKSFITSGAFDKFAVQNVTYKGQIWAVPIFLGENAIFYNKDMFAAAGLQPPKTMDDIMKDAPLLTKRDSSGNVTRSGLSLRLSGQGSGVAEKFWIFLMQYGTPQQPLGLLAKTANGKYHASYANDAGVKVLEMYVNFVNKKPLVDDTKIASDAQAFEQQKTAMFARESWVIGDIAKNAPTLNYGTVPMPTTSLHSPEGMFVASSSKHQQTAWDFLRFLEELPQQQSIATISGWVPARVNLDYSALIQKQPAWDAFLDKDPNYQAGYQTDYPLPEWDEIETKLADHLVATYTDKSLVDNPAGAMQKLKQFADESNSILKAHNDYGE